MANPVDVVISGAALNSLGLVATQYTVNGLDLNTFGFLTPCDAIWTPSAPAITTTWTCSEHGGSGLEVCND